MQRQRNEKKRKEQQRQLRDMIERARSASTGMVQISTMEQFQQQMTVIEGSMRVYKTHCLIMFVANKQAEKIGEEELFFPYPFTGEAGGQNGYRNLLQVAKVRFNTQTELTRLFGAGHHNTPHIIFGRQGDAVGDFAKYRQKGKMVDAHTDFKKWVESSLIIHGTVANSHSLPVHMMVLRDGNIIYSEPLDPHYKRTFAFHAGDRVIAYDERVGTFPIAPSNDIGNIVNAKGVLLLDEIVTTLSQGMYRIKKRCYDLSPQCHSWTLTSKGKKNRQCERIAEFMHHMCPYTCGVCNERITSSITYLIFHYPIHQFPSYLQGTAQFGRVFAEDMNNVLQFRKNAAASFFAVGLLIAFNITLFTSFNTMSGKRNIHNRPRLLPIFESFLLIVSAAVCAGMNWLLSATVREVPIWLRGFHRDFNAVVNHFNLYMLLLAIGVVCAIYVRALITSVRNYELDMERAMIFIVIPFTLVGPICKIWSSSTTSYHWEYTWKYRKNAAFAIFAVGGFAGVGLVSLKRLVLQNLPIIPIILNLVAAASAWAFAASDPSFKADIMNVLELRKNVAAAFVLLGIFAGEVVVGFSGKRKETCVNV